MVVVPKAPQLIGPGAVDVAFQVNGDAVTVHVPPHRTLLDTSAAAIAERKAASCSGAKRSATAPGRGALARSTSAKSTAAWRAIANVNRACPRSSL